MQLLRKFVGWCETGPGIWKSQIRNERRTIMRMLNDVNEILCVDEILCLNAVPMWNAGHTDDLAPDLFYVTAITAADTDDDEEIMYIGEYEMDRTRGTYEKAVANFNRICEKAAVHGYFRLSDFQNFILT